MSEPIGNLMGSESRFPPLSLGDRVTNNLVRLRHATGLTQQELASKAGVSRATIYLIEAGEGDPRLSTLELLAKALGVDVAELLRQR